MCSRTSKDSDETILPWGQAEGAAFDRESKTLKDQAEAFTTNWCVIKFHSKERMIIVPEKKWIKFRFFANKPT